MNVDPWILAFSAVTVIATVWMGFWSARRSKTTSDFFVAGRSVSVGWNASAISGEYLSAASFMGVAGMVMSSGYDALWYPVCYACGYLFLLLFIAGPLRRFGAYTIPDFAEGRFDSPVFRKIAVVFVLFIGFFYTMPQMKGAGTTLAYIFPGLPYWAGVVLVGAVITLNVALGGMKGITLVQAFQYWAKMFAISVPIFVLMAVYGNYGKQLQINTSERGVDFPVTAKLSSEPREFRKQMTPFAAADEYARLMGCKLVYSGSPDLDRLDEILKGRLSRWGLLKGAQLPTKPIDFETTVPEGGLLTNLPSPLSNTVQLSLGPSARTSGSKRTVVWSGPLPGGTNTTSIEAWYVMVSPQQRVIDIWRKLKLDGVDLIPMGEGYLLASVRQPSISRSLPEKAPGDATWLNPFGPLTTKAAKAAAAVVTNDPAVSGIIPLAPSFASTNRVAVNFIAADIRQVLPIYSDLTARTLLPRTNAALEKVDALLNGQLARWQLIEPGRVPFAKLTYHPTNYVTVGELKRAIEDGLKAGGVTLVPVGERYFRAIETSKLDDYWKATVENRQRAWLAKHERPLALLYTYSLIIALVCGTAGLPHILVRFYTNPDGVAAKRTTMWVMILIGVFYVFPPVFGVMGRNLMPSLYEGVGAKGTDKVVLELPRILNSHSPADSPTRSTDNQVSVSAGERVSGRKIPWGSIFSGITCAGAFAAFMSTFSGLLVSMTGAMAHDVYGRMLNPKATPQQRLRAFKIAAVIIGGVAILLGMQVEPLQINFMVGQAFAIAAASYFPLLFMSAWWRGMTTRGAAVGMLTGGLLALIGISLTSFSDLSIAGGDTAKLFAAFKPLNNFWATHPLLRILCEQPAIWTVPLAIALMVIVSKLTRREVPDDIRMKMLVLHAPEKLGLKQEYIQEHQHGH